MLNNVKIEIAIWLSHFFFVSLQQETTNNKIYEKF